MANRLPQPRFEATIEITDSDWIKSIQYDDKKCILDANLRNGDRYRYRNVFSGTVVAIVFARSSGRAFNRHLKRADFTKLPRK